MRTVREAALAEIGDKPRRPIAERAGISEAQLSRFLAGRVEEPTLSFISKLEVGLGLRKGALLRAAGYVEDPISAREAIAQDEHLRPAFKAQLIGLYDTLRKFEEEG